MAEEKSAKEENRHESETQKPPPQTPQEDKLNNPGKAAKEPDKAREKEAADPGKGTGSKFDTQVAGNVGNMDQAEKMVKFDQKNVKQFFLGDGKSAEIRMFSVSHALPLSKENINTVGQVFVYPEDRSDELISCLRAYRILLLTGGPETGKYFIAKYLSFRMLKEEQKDYEVRWSDPLAWKISVEPMGLIKHAKALQGKILIFKNVFSQRDQGVIDFFRTCSPEQTEFIAGRLKELDAYLLFTADSKTFDRYLLSGIPVIKEISLLDHDLLQKGFDLKLAHFCSLDSQRNFNKASQLLAGKKREIIRKLERMPLITLFIENSLDKIVSGKSIDESIEEVRDIRKHLEHRFLKELGQDKTEFEAWTFALCLALFNGSPYRDFHQIHRDITRILLDKFDPLQTFKDFRFALSEGELLEKCRAQITKDMETHADRIEFCYPFYQEVLLDILLGNNRSVLLDIVPYLEEYIENHNQLSLLKTAAASLGRIGALDPKGIILPIMVRWNTDKGQENFHRSTLGYLFEGIMGSDDEIYKTYCLGKLKEMAFSDDVDEQWTAIAAYKQIGLHDLEFALAELRKIQEESVKRMLKDQKFLDIVYSHTDLLDDRDVLANLERIYEETEAILFYVRYSIVGLSILLEPIDVLDELRKWIHEGNLSSKMSVVSLFMGPGGILAELGEQVQEPSPGNKGKKETESYHNRLFYALTNGDEPVKKMAAFLKDLYKRCFSEFQQDEKKVLKRLLFNYLQKWALDSLSDERVSNALKELIIRLYKSGDDELKDTLWDNVNRWHAPEENEAELEAFVDGVTKQLFNI